jgi:alcohol dehydrogenase (cytochrome c)
MRILSFLLVLTAALLPAQTKNYTPVTEEMLANPSPDDWLMYSRTYDAQRFSPLKQINKANVGQLRLSWSRVQPTGAQEGIPLVHNGVMYVLTPGSAIQALDATNGDLLWEYQRKLPDNVRNGARSKTIAIWQDLIYTTTADSYVVALDARTGEMRWESKTDTRGQTSGAIVAGDKVISGGACGGNHNNCYISAHDAKTGKLLWKFFTAANKADPGGDSWGDTPDDKRFAGTWGLPGTYDPVTKLIIWSVANPTPNTRAERHNGNPMGTSTSAPADLFSNCTVAIDPETGKMVWYFQHLPGDDWDEDWTNERILMSSPVSPTAATAKWFNPKVKAGEKRDIAMAIGESGGIFALDRRTGEFLWANPWPYDVPNFVLSGVDPDGKTHINQSLIFTGPNQRKTICFFNSKSYWPAAYSPATNSVYAPWVDTCLDMRTLEPGVRPRRDGMVRPGSNPDEFSGISKINVATGKIEHIFKGPAPINGAILATAGDLVFFGDLNRRMRALDANNGKVLWEQAIGGPIANSTITYSVKGQQYIAVMTGDGLLTPSVIGYAPSIKPPKGANGIYVFALPEKK